MKFGFSLPHSGPTSRPRELGTIARHAEKLGFDYLIESSDHIVVPEKIGSRYPYSATGEYTDSPEDLEQLSTIAFVAAKTKRVRILSAITVLPYRPPILTAKMLATIDYLSNGRLTVGVGVGWLKEEFDVLGVQFEERGKLADEYIEAFRRLWSASPASYHGKFCNFDDVKLTPEPVQGQRLPIWVGGESIGAMRRAARLGDSWIPIGANPSRPLGTLDDLKKAVHRFKTYVREAGRSEDQVGVGYMVPEYRLDENLLDKEEQLFVGPARKLANNVRKLEELGISFLGFGMRQETVDGTLDEADRFASQVMDQVQR